MKKYNQLCVWQGCTLGEQTQKDFENFMMKEFRARVKFEAEVALVNQADQSDLFFYIHDDDIMSFAVPRLQVGIRWWEDVLLNGHGNDYPHDFRENHPATWSE